MPPFIRFLIRRVMAIPVTLFVITALLYGVVMLAPPEVRAELYLPRGTSNNPNADQEAMIQELIERKGLNDPYPVQYARWLARLILGDWGWSPQLRGDVLEALLKRTPATAELTLYSVLALVPLGLASGVAAGRKEGRLSDHGFRVTAFVATSVPPFILALVLLSIFYAGLGWFQPGRLSISEGFVVTSPAFKSFTGLLTIDGLLNGRFDITLSALRHLVLPAVTLGLAHWATLGRLTRAAIVEELGKDYVLAARGRGVPEHAVVWRHALRNAMLPPLNSTALSAASLVMGVFVVETIFELPGVSELVTSSWIYAPDASVALGFAVYSVLLVLPLMLVFDVVQGISDPRIREGVAES